MKLNKLVPMQIPIVRTCRLLPTRQNQSFTVTLDARKYFDPNIAIFDNGSQQNPYTVHTQRANILIRTPLKSVQVAKRFYKPIKKQLDKQQLKQIQNKNNLSIDIDDNYQHSIQYDNLIQLPQPKQIISNKLTHSSNYSSNFKNKKRLIEKFINRKSLSFKQKNVLNYLQRLKNQQKYYNQIKKYQINNISLIEGHQVRFQKRKHYKF